jgi:hypothetical protein
VNSIGVGTLSRRIYVEQLNLDILTSIKPEMKLGAVLNFKSLDCQIGTHEEFYGLHHKFQRINFQEMHFFTMETRNISAVFVTYNWAVTRTFCPTTSLLH